jgi:hypothetical protein
MVYLMLLNGEGANKKLQLQYPVQGIFFNSGFISGAGCF